MPSMHHSLAQFEGSGALLCSFKILNTAGTPTITEVSPPAFNSADIAVTDTAQGVYDITIANFKGPAGVAHVFATCYTISNFAACTARSYSSDTLSITIKTGDDAAGAQDTSTDVLVLAW